MFSYKRHLTKNKEAEEVHKRTTSTHSYGAHTHGEYYGYEKHSEHRTSIDREEKKKHYHTKRELFVGRGIISKYFSYLRTQSFEMQQIHATLFAGVVTLLLGYIVFYSDFGLGGERYSATQVQESISTKESIEEESPSPIEFISSFVREAKARLDLVGTGSSSLLESKETYTRDESKGE